jgi:hypothetical protein
MNGLGIIFLIIKKIEIYIYYLCQKYINIIKTKNLQVFVGQV